MRARSRLGIVVASMLVATSAGCGSDQGATDGGAVTGPDGPGLDAGETTGSPWCGVYSEILAFTGDIDGADAERAQELMARFEDQAPEPVAAEAARLATLLDAPPQTADDEVHFARDLAAVASYAHQTCGTEHPFCAVWPVFSYYVASSAVAGEDESGDTQTVIDGYSSLVLDHLPPDLAGDDAVLRQAFSTEPEGEDERRAEEAVDRADAWVEANCETAQR